MVNANKRNEIITKKILFEIVELKSELLAAKSG